MLFIAIIGVFLSSCSSTLDESPDGRTSLNDIFSDNDETSAYLNTCYEYIPNGGHYYWHSTGQVLWCDEAWDGDDSEGTSVSMALRYYKGDASASDHPALNPARVDCNNGEYWNYYWSGIYYCDYFLTHIKKSVVTDSTNYNRWKAEAHVLRAYYYSKLLQWFGCSLPIIEKPYEYTADFSKVKRSSFYNVAKFVVADCDSAIACEDLPWRITTSGEKKRMTRAVAEAIRSRIMLYAASPLYCDSVDCWEEAYEVNKAAMTDLKANGYELYNQVSDEATYEGTGSHFAYSGYSLTEKAALFNEYFCTQAQYSLTPADKETIYQDDDGNNEAIFNVDGVGCQGFKVGTCPSQELVDCFETTDGQPILDLSNPYSDEYHTQPNYNSSNTLYDQNNPYKNRDPRFYATIYYNGSIRKAYWPFAETSASPENYPAAIGTRARNIMTYVGEPYTGITTSSGTNARQHTRTGYYERKFLHPNSGSANSIWGCAFKEFRLAEVILNFAETAANSGHEDEAREAVDEIRERAGMPDLPATLGGQDLLNRIYNERRVELALEGFRYFDVRRLHKSDEDLSSTDKYVTSMVITRNTDGSFTYNREAYNGVRQCYTNKWLKLPIPLTEVNRIIAITGNDWQNTGW